MEHIIEFSKNKTFQLEEAQGLIPIVLRFTENSNVKVQSLLRQIERLTDREASDRQQIEKEIDLTVRAWQQKIEKLGALAKGLWLVDFDNGQGYFCWKFPERKIMFFHGYQDGFTGRRALEP